MSALQSKLTETRAARDRFMREKNSAEEARGIAEKARKESDVKCERHGNTARQIRELNRHLNDEIAYRGRALLMYGWQDPRK